MLPAVASTVATAKLVLSNVKAIMVVRMPGDDGDDINQGVDYGEGTRGYHFIPDQIQTALLHPGCRFGCQSDQCQQIHWQYRQRQYWQGQGLMVSQACDGNGITSGISTSWASVILRTRIRRESKTLLRNMVGRAVFQSECQLGCQLDQRQLSWYHTQLDRSELPSRPCQCQQGQGQLDEPVSWPAKQVSVGPISAIPMPHSRSPRPVPGCYAKGYYCREAKAGECNDQCSGYLYGVSRV